MGFEGQFRPQVGELAEWLEYLQSFGVGFRICCEDSKGELSELEPFGMVFMIFAMARVVIRLIDFPLFREGVMNSFPLF
jgi:hypothetical protein